MPADVVEKGQKDDNIVIFSVKHKMLSYTTSQQQQMYWNRVLLCVCVCVFVFYASVSDTVHHISSNRALCVYDTGKSETS